MQDVNVNKDWIPLLSTFLAILGTLFGVLIGGAISLVIKWFEVKNQRTLENKKLRLSKLEELYQILHRHPMNFVRGLEKVKNTIDEQFLEIPVDTLDMIVEFYVPEIASNLEKLVILERQLANEYFAYKANQTETLRVSRQVREKLNESAVRLLSQYREFDASLDDTCLKVLKPIVDGLTELARPLDEVLDSIPTEVADKTAIESVEYFKRLKEVESECNKMQEIIVRSAKELIGVASESRFSRQA